MLRLLCKREAETALTATAAGHRHAAGYDTTDALEYRVRMRMRSEQALFGHWPQSVKRKH